MKSPAFRKKKNPATVIESIINKHFDSFRFLDCPISILKAGRKFSDSKTFYVFSFSAQART
jgi:hypothetical protein